MNSQVNGSGERMKFGYADYGGCISFPDSLMRLGAKEASAV